LTKKIRIVYEVAHRAGGEAHSNQQGRTRLYATGGSARPRL